MILFSTPTRIFKILKKKKKKKGLEDHFIFLRQKLAGRLHIKIKLTLKQNKNGLGNPKKKKNQWQ